MELAESTAVKEMELAESTAVKNPRRPRRALTAVPDDVVVYDRALFTVYPTTGPYRRPWNRLRTWGPVASRWDPQPEPAADHPDNGVLYAAGDVTTSLAEVFQDRRAVTLSDHRALAGWRPTRPLRLLDLTGTWAVRNGASASLHAADKSTCRAWARQIRQTWPDLDGLHVPSTMTLRPMLVVYAPAADSFPAWPAVARSLTHPDLAAMITDAADELGWPIRTA